MNRRQFVSALVLPLVAGCTYKVDAPPERIVLEADLRTELLQIGDVKQNPVIGIWVQRVAAGNNAASFRCLSMICTHARCNTVYQPGVNEFHCPCHQSKFDGSGAVLNGPASLPLPAFPFQLQNGRLIIVA
jgi:Rieske Fe-S protein